jgi:hypothetical protein
VAASGAQQLFQDAGHVSALPRSVTISGFSPGRLTLSGKWSVSSERVR